MSKTTVGEYLSISNNLGNKAREAFKEGNIKKSAAVEIASLPEKEQEKLIEKGVTAQKDIKAYKVYKENIQPEEDESLPGQLKVSNTDMDIEEELPKEHEPKADEVKADEVELPEYTPAYFLKEQKGKLEDILAAQRRGDVVPDIAVQRQKIIVAALAAMVSELSEL